EWNAIGPIPKRKTKKIWNRFKKAIDSIQDQRRSFFKQQRLDQKENLVRKREIIDRINALATGENPEELVPQVKELQAEYQKTGFVTIKQKNRVWDEYRKACDEFYKNLRATSSDSPHHREPSGHSAPSDNAAKSGLRQKQQEIFRLKKECDALNETI